MDINRWLNSRGGTICANSRSLSQRALVAIVYHRQREFVSIIICKDVCFLLVEKFNALFSDVYQIIVNLSLHGLAVSDYFVVSETLYKSRTM